MKKLFGIVLVSIFASVMSFAQVPQSFKYQAIARDIEGNIISDQQISMRISLLQESKTGTAVYSETHKLNTNRFGLINLEIGMGKNKSGDFSTIKWGLDKYFVNVEIDINGGSDYKSIGVSQLLSVPYALYAEKSGTSASLSTGSSASLSTGKEANSWTDGASVTYLTNSGWDVGIGTSAPTSKLDVIGKGTFENVYGSKTDVTTASGHLVSNKFEVLYEPTSTSAVKGSSLQIKAVTADPAYTDFTSFLQGLRFSLIHRNNGTISQLIGGRFQMGMPTGTWGGTGTSGNIVSMKGIDMELYSQKGITIFGTGISLESIGSNFSNLTYLRINQPTDVAGNFGIYNNSTYPNYFAGNVGIGTTAPAGILDIAGVYHFPSTDGTNGQVLKTNGGGTLSWANALGGATAINDLSDAVTDDKSIFLGSGSGVVDDGNENRNVAIGIESLNSSVDGEDNTVCGYQAMYTNTTGDENVAIGSQALYSSTYAMWNVAVGAYALMENVTGELNTAIGFKAATNNDGNSNVIIGTYADDSNIKGSGNTIIGSQAGRASKLHTKNGCVLIGKSAGAYDTVDNKLYIANSHTNMPLVYGEFDNKILRVNGTLDIKNAYQFPITDGTNGQVLRTNGSGILSWSNGGAAEINDLSDGRTGGFSVFLGHGAGLNDDLVLNYNVAVGDSALNKNTSGYQNTAIGYIALKSNVNGISNTACGYRALSSNTSGGNNTATGVDALKSNDNGSHNTATGFYALSSNTSGSNNTAVGTNALLDNISGAYNTAIGVNALSFNSTGGNNTASGHMALYKNTAGFYNMANGFEASYENTTGNSNISIGYQANRYNQTGHNNTIIGFQAGRATVTHSKSGCVFLGYKAGHNDTTDNKLYIDNSETGIPLIYGEFDNNEFVEIRGNLGLEARTFGGGTRTLALKNGTVPTSSITDGVLLYTEDEAVKSKAVSSELKVRDESGQVTTLSPHNFTMINKSEPMAWSFYSENHNESKKINVDMLKAIRVLENISGEKLAFIQDIKDNSKQKEETYIGIIQELRQEIADLRERIEELEE